MYKICVDRLFILLVRLLVNSRLLLVFGESKVICGFLTAGVRHPNLHIVQGSTVYGLRRVRERRSGSMKKMTGPVSIRRGNG